MDESTLFHNLDVFSVLPDPVVILDAKGTIQWGNQATFDLAQVNKEELIGLRFTKITTLRLRDIPKYIKVFAQVLRGDDVQPMRVTWDMKDGSVQDSEVHIHRFRTADEKRAILVIAKNITNQEEIREAYQLAQLSIESASDPIFWVDDESNLVYANKSACKLLNYSKEELTNMVVHDIDVKHSKEHWPEFIKGLKANGTSTFETIVLTKDKRKIPIEIRVQRLNYDDKSLNFAYLEDITDRKLAESSLIQSEQRNQMIIDAMSDLVLVYDENEYLIEYYSSDESLLYQPWKQMVGKKLEEFMPSHYVEKHNSNLEQVRDTGKSATYEYDLEIGGEVRWFRATMTPLETNNRTVVAIKEITEKKTIEIALENSEKRFKDMFLNAAVGFFRTNLEGQVLECNLTGAKLLGYDNPEDVMKDYNLRERYADTSSREQLLQELTQHGVAHDFQTQITKQDGTPFWIELSSRWNPDEEYLETVVIDISERKETETKLMESEERFRNIFDSMPLGMFFYELNEDNELIFSDSNLAADEILGVDCSKLLGKPLEEAFPGLVGTEVPERYKKTACDGIPWHNQEINYNEGAISGVYDVYAFQTMKGKMVASFLDITDKKATQEALQTSLLRYRELLENLPAGVGITDLNDKLVYANPAYSKLMGYEADELVGMSVLDFVVPEEHEKILSETEIRKSGDSSLYEMNIIRKDGTRRLIRISAVPDRDDTGKIIGTIGLLTDISESKRAEEALKASEERMRKLIEQLPLGVAIADLSEEIQLANQAMADLLMLEKQKLVGSKLNEYLNPDSAKLMLAQTKTRKQGKHSAYNIDMIRSDGEERLVRIVAAPNYNSEGKTIGSVGIFEDITEQKANEVVRARQEQEINLYGSLLRHDLRNDLGLILSYIEAVQMLLKDPDEEIISFMESALASIERMANLLKNFGRPQNVKEVDIVEFISEISEETQEAEKNLKISVDYATDTKPIRITTGSLLALVFMNLFRNSAQHAGPNPIIAVKVSRSNQKMEIIVSDNGPGVPEEFQARLFSRGTSSKGEAGGLGLYLCRQIIEGTGGSIKLDSGAPGATFKLQLPLDW